MPLTALQARLKIWHVAGAAAGLTAAIPVVCWLVRRSLPRLPGPAGWPLVGSVLELIKFDGELYLAFLDWRKRYGDAFRFRLFWVECTVLFLPSHIQQVMVQENWPKSVFHRSMIPVMGEGLVLSNGELWQRHRKLMSPAFSPIRLQQVVLPHFLRYAKKFRWQLEQLEDGTQVDILNHLTRVTLDIICSAGFSFQLNSMDGENVELLEAFERILSVSSNFAVLLPGVPQLMRFLRRHDIAAVDRIINSAIDARIKEREHGIKAAGRDWDMLDLLLDAEDGGMHMGRRAIRDEIYIFFLAGHETTALNLTWTLYELARHPLCKLRMIEELDAVRANASPSASPSGRHLSATSLPYTECVLKEALRRYPALVATVRSVPSGRPLTVEGHRLEAGSAVFVPIYSKHHEEDAFHKPNSFIPERWESAKVPPTSFMPFTLGPRICIGQHFFFLEAKALLFELLSTVTFELPTGIAKSDQIVGTSRTGTFRPKQPIRLVLCHRRPCKFDLAGLQH